MKPRAGIYHSALHMGEEPVVIGNELAGMVLFSGCHLRCASCYTPEVAFGRQGIDVTAAQLSAEMVRLQVLGAKNILFISPTHVWPQIYPAMTAWRQRQQALPLILKTSGYERGRVLEQLFEVADVWVPDLKVVSREAAQRQGLPVNYGKVALAAIEKAEQSPRLGPSRFGTGEKLIKGTLVRHLIQPGFEDEALRVIEELGHRHFSGILNLMTIFVRPGGQGIQRADPAVVERLVRFAYRARLRVLVDGREKSILGGRHVDAA